MLCPRNCRVNRLAGEKGICGETAALRIASIDAHFGEEPPITGTNGSGTVFFSGCTLRCTFCQNYQISADHYGYITTPDEIATRLRALHLDRGIHNVNFVTPDHFLPHTVEIVNSLRRGGTDLPILYNTSGYMSVNILKELEEYADIYMPDYKYSDPQLARSLSRARDYPDIALDAIAEMVRQKGFLNSQLEKRLAATQGVLVRHLVLPGHVDNSMNALSILFNEFGPDLPVSLMSQYWPARTTGIEELDRQLTFKEFYRVYDHALELGFNNMFVQHIEGWQKERAFVPDFHREKPFRGNYEVL